MLSDSLRSILSPVDFSEQSRQALQWAGAFATRFGSRLTVVSVVEPLLAEAARIRLGRDLTKPETEPALREFVAATWPTGTGAPPQIVYKTLIADPASAILETATADNADLIVIGTQGLSGFRKWLLGSTTERVLRRTHVPVLAVPLATESQLAPADVGAVAHILGAIDFSDASVSAAKIAAELARAFSATLTLTNIVEPVIAPPQWLPLVEETDEMRVASARKELHTLSQRICGTQACDEVVALGRPADVIASLARARRAQLIVMGLASEQGVFAPHPGSIAYRVLSSTTIPVLVVPSALR